MKTLFIYTDGAARGNPGLAGAGWVISEKNGKILKEGKKFLGRMTNNQAEYEALLCGVGDALQMNAKTIEIFADSELLVRQLKGEYKVKNEGLKPLYQKAILTLEEFDQYVLSHIPREQNAAADRLANEAIDNSLT